jgi:nucleotide-binding universal stress UspA family protein
MYKKILIAIENSTADRTVLEHVQQLAKLTGASLLLVHVADGWVARHYDELALRESEEMKEDRAYLATVQAQLTANGFTTVTHLAMGEPAKELVRVAEAEHVDLIAMSTHGHRFFNDLLRGTTVSKVRHFVKIPVLLLRAQ